MEQIFTIRDKCLHISGDDKVMNIKKTIFLLIFILSSCTNYKTEKFKQTEEKIFYSSSGFALIYDHTLYEQGLINKKLSNSKRMDNKLNDEKIIVMHSFLEKNTPVKIINPETSKIIKTKIFKKANYPEIFNIVISKKTAEFLDLDFDNPFIEILELKKNMTFIAKETNMFEEEKNVAGTAPVDKVLIDDLTKEKNFKKKKINKKNSFILVISDFYFLNSANNLKTELFKKTQINNFSVKKIKNNVYRLYAGPFQSFNALKSTYISLNNLGFGDLNIYKK